MNGLKNRTLLVMACVIFIISSIMVDNTFSREKKEDLAKEVMMDDSMGLTIPEGYERATFAHG